MFDCAYQLCIMFKVIFKSWLLYPAIDIVTNGFTQSIYFFQNFSIVWHGTANILLYIVHAQINKLNFNVQIEILGSKKF
jgi:hypothetical protein